MDEAATIRHYCVGFLIVSVNYSVFRLASLSASAAVHGQSIGENSFHPSLSRLHCQLILQIYGLFCCWIHLRWVRIEMPHLSTIPQDSLWRMMFPCIGYRSSSAAGTGASEAQVATTPTTPTTNGESNVEAGAESSSQLQQPSIHPSTPSLAADPESIPPPAESEDQETDTTGTPNDNEHGDIQVVVQR